MLYDKLAHLACPENQRTPTFERPEDLFRELYRHTRHGERVVSEPRLRADPLTDPQGGMEEPVQNRARAQLLGRRPVRLANQYECRSRKSRSTPFSAARASKSRAFAPSSSITA